MDHAGSHRSSRSARLQGSDTNKAAPATSDRTAPAPSRECSHPPATIVGATWLGGATRPPPPQAARPVDGRTIPGRPAAGPEAQPRADAFGLHLPALGTRHHWVDDLVL